MIFGTNFLGRGHNPSPDSTPYPSAPLFQTFGSATVGIYIFDLAIIVSSAFPGVVGACVFQRKVLWVHPETGESSHRIYKFSLSMILNERSCKMFFCSDVDSQF